MLHAFAIKVEATSTSGSCTPHPRPHTPTPHHPPNPQPNPPPHHHTHPSTTSSAAPRTVHWCTATLQLRPSQRTIASSSAVKSMWQTSQQLSSSASATGAGMRSRRINHLLRSRKSSLHSSPRARTKKLFCAAVVGHSAGELQRDRTQWGTAEGGAFRPAMGLSRGWVM